MPNPVAVNDLSPISGSLQTSRVSYGVETAGKNYGQNYNSTNWYSDIPNNGQSYTIISDNYTANYYVSRSNAEGAYVEGGLPAVDEYSAPVFWTTVGTSSLDVITIVNGLPDRIGQVPFNSGSQALNWVASSSNYFAVGPDYYDQIDADNLIFCIEGNQIISYPTTGSTWYDLSGYFMKGTLTNGTTWNSNDYMVFDGTDDYINFGNNSTFNVGTTGSLSIDILFKTTDTTGALVTKRLGSGPQVYVYSSKFYADGGGTAGVSSANNVNNNRWNKGTAIFDRASSLLRLFVNGVADNTTAFGSTTLTDTSDLYLGTALLGSGVPQDFYTGSIAEVLIYPKALTAAEVAQNYYGGPIVTDGLQVALDISNLVSYPKSGTTVYDLTGNYGITATNSSYEVTPDGVPAWRFTGNNSRLDVVNFNVADSSNTYEGWFKIDKIGVNEGKANNWNTLFDSGTERPLVGFYNGIGYVYPVQYGGAYSITSGVWFHIAVVFVSNNDVTVFLNGQKVVANANWGNIQRTGTFNFWIGGDMSVESSDSWLSNCRLYDRALTDSEVLQNYNATN